MINLNRAMIIGNVTRDIEMRYTPGGQPVSSFSVATNRRWTDSQGNNQEEVEFHDVVAWGKLAEIAAQVLGKGRKVYVEGRLKTRNWEGQDGVKRYKTEIIADNLIALDRPATAEEPDAEPGTAAPVDTVASPDTPSATTPAPAEDFPIEDASQEKGKEKSKKAKDEQKPADSGDINLEDIPF